MQIERINNNPDKLSAYFRLASVYGSVFNSEPWVNAFKEVLDIYCFCDNEGKVTGGFQMTREKKALFFSFLRTPLYQPNIAFFFEPRARNAAKQNDEIRSYIRAISNSSLLKATVLSYAFPPEFKDMLPFVHSGFKVIPNYTYQINLQQSEEQIFSLFSPERRNDINRAVKDGLVCRQENNTDVIFDLINQTFSEKKDHLYTGHVKKILQAFHNNPYSCGFVTRTGETPLAACYVLYTKRRAYYLLGGYSHNNRHGGAGAMAIWEAIKFLKKQEVQWFDFEGSMIPEVEKYFRGFGGELVPYYMVNKASFAIEVLLKTIKRSQF